MKTKFYEAFRALGYPDAVLDDAWAQESILYAVAALRRHKLKRFFTPGEWMRMIGSAAGLSESAAWREVATAWQRRNSK